VLAAVLSTLLFAVLPNTIAAVKRPTSTESTLTIVARAGFSIAPFSFVILCEPFCAFYVSWLSAAARLTEPTNTARRFRVWKFIEPP
jgi:ABC-type dipeptide/oligopeptide/nickel transport system permease component